MLKWWCQSGDVEAVDIKAKSVKASWKEKVGRSVGRSFVRSSVGGFCA